MYVSLLKKSLIETFGSFGKKKKNILGMLISLAIAATLIIVCVLIFKAFLSMYEQVAIDGIKDFKARQYEVLAIYFFVIIVVNVISAIGGLNKQLIENEDVKIFTTLPIKLSTLFLSKLTIMYVKQFVVALATVLPVTIVFAMADYTSAYFYGMTVVICFLFPLLTLPIASIFVLPFYYFKRFIQSKYIMLLLLVTGLAVLFIFGYSYILETLKTLIATGEVRFAFSQGLMTKIVYVTQHLYPANLLANIMVGQKIWQSMLIFVGIVVVFVAIGITISSMLLLRASQDRIISNRKFRFNSKHNTVVNGKFGALLNKEFVNTLRTPSYAFQYFSMAIILPLLVYFCTKIGCALVRSLVMIPCDFEATFLVMMLFSGLTNTFCATNISRDGTSFGFIKTLPLNARQVVGSKVLFCMIVSVISMFASYMVVSGFGYVSWLDGFIIFIATTAVGFAQICIGTRLDLKRPVFSTDDDCEIKEDSNSVSIMVLISFIIALLIGGVLLYTTILRGSLKNEYIAWIKYVVLGLTAVFAVGLGFLVFFVGLRKRYSGQSGVN